MKLLRVGCALVFGACALLVADDASAQRWNCGRGRRRSRGCDCRAVEGTRSATVEGEHRCVCVDLAVCGGGATPSPAPPPTRPTEGCVRLAGGTLTMGDADDGPAHRVTLGPFCIDRTEVTVAAYRACVDARECEAPSAYASGGDGWRLFCNWGRSGRDAHPVNCVTAEQAENFCARRRRGHLPTEDQWEFAARGTEGRRYPWGDAPEPSPQNSNLCGSECASFAASVGTARWYPIANWTDPWPMTAAVANLPSAGDTPEGLIGMAGNVSEWTRTPWSVYSAAAGYVRVDRTLRVVRGAGWRHNVPFAARADRRSACGSADWYHEVGFRCVGEGG